MDIGIPPPQRPTSDPDAALECTNAIDGAVHALVEPALVFEAVMRAAGHQAAAYLEDPDPADDPAMPRPDAALAGGKRRAD
ncbi:MAG: hypothetical protein J0H80_10625 [Rhizobiales bacterium]|nr:hypothetical protein [Hyphomicrobiales bacterium]